MYCALKKETYKKKAEGFPNFPGWKVKWNCEVKN
jgi:hypothetical protein